MNVDTPPHPPADVTVLGAGIVGICTALYLREQGLTVRLVDQQGPAEACSYGNAGVLGAWGVVPAALPGIWRDIPGWLFDGLGPIALHPTHLPRLAPWLWRFARSARPDRIRPAAAALFHVVSPCVDLYRQLLDGTGHESLIRDAWYLYVTRHPAKTAPGGLGWRLRREFGAPMDVLDAAELRQHEPALSPRYTAGVRIKSQGRTVNPGRLGKVLADKFEANGGEMVRATAQRIRPAGAETVHLDTDTGTLSSNWLVVAAGVWTKALVAPLGCDIALEPERGYHMEFANPGVALNHSVSDLDRQYAASSMEGGVRLAGTSEFNHIDAAPDWRRAQMLKTLGRQLLPDLNVDEGVPWMGQRPATPDSVPIIGPVKHHPRVILATGHGHLGLTCGPMTGRIVTSMVTSTPLNFDTGPYSPDRFERA